MAVLKFIVALTITTGLFFTSVSDNFSGADDPTGLGANWTCTGSDRFNVVSHTAVSNGSAPHNEVACSWTANSFADAQHVEGKINSLGSTQAMVGVRMNGTTWATLTGYFVGHAHTGGGDEVLRLYQYDGAEAFTQVGTDFGSFVLDTDVIGVDISGTTVNVTKNGSNVLTATVSGTYTSGTTGILAYDQAGGTAHVNAWAANDGGAGPTVPAAIFSNVPIGCCKIELPRVQHYAKF